MRRITITSSVLPGWVQPVLEYVVRIGALVGAHARVVLRSHRTRRPRKGERMFTDGVAGICSVAWI